MPDTCSQKKAKLKNYLKRRANRAKIKGMEESGRPKPEATEVGDFVKALEVINNIIETNSS